MDLEYSDLLKEIKDRALQSKKFEEIEALYIASDVLRGCEFLKGFGVYNNDLKP